MTFSSDISDPSNFVIKVYHQNQKTIFPLIVTLFGIVYNGYQFAINDHVLQLPLVDFYNSRSLFKGDIIISQTGYVSFFWVGFAFFTRYFQAWLFAFVLYLLCMYLYFKLTYLIGELVTESELGGYILTILLFSPKPGLGYDIMTHDIWLSLRVVSLPLVLYAMYYALQDKYSRSYIAIGFAFYFHPISAITAGFLISCGYLGNGYQNKSFQHILILLRSASLSVLIALPGIIYILINRNSGFDTSEAWIKIMHMRNAHMVFPLSFGIEVYLNIITYFLLMWLCARDMNTKSRNMLFSWVIGIGILFLINFVFSEVYPSPFFIQLQLHRSLRFLPIITMIFLTRSLCDLDLGGNLGKRESYILLSTVFLIFSSYFFIFLIPIITLFLIPKNIALNFSTHSLSRKKVFGMSIIILLAILPHLIAGIILTDKPIGNISIRSSQEQPWIEVQEWVEENTPIDIIIITPPHLEGFRVYSHRTIVGEWKDGTLSFFNETFALDWWQRMMDLGFTESNYNRYHDRIYMAINFMSIGEKYGSNLIVVFTRMLSDLLFDHGIVFQNDEFSIIQLL